MRTGWVLGLGLGIHLRAPGKLIVFKQPSPEDCKTLRLFESKVSQLQAQRWNRSMAMKSLGRGLPEFLGPHQR